MNILKSLLAAVCLVAAVVPSQAATPTLTNFNAMVFIVDATADPTNVIQLRLSQSQFHVSPGGITLSNVATSVTIITNGYTIFSNVVNNFVSTTNIFTNVQQVFNLVTNYFTNVTQVFETNIFNIKNSEIIITNTLVTINGTNVPTINPTDLYYPYRAGSNYFYDSTMFHSDGITKVDSNVGAVLTVGDATFVNLLKGSQTNSVSGAISIAHATNGLHNVELTHIRTFFVPSGGPHTLTIPTGWRTNVYSAVPPALTNGTITKMFVRGMGPTADAASQTNCYVSFEYYK